MNEDTLKKASNAQYKKAIEKKFSYALPEMLHIFSVSFYHVMRKPVYVLCQKQSADQPVQYLYL